MRTPHLLALALTLSVPIAADVWYVDIDTPAAPEAQDGVSWPTAFDDIQSAVDAAHDAGGGEVWVAEGTYTADTDPVLTMKEDVHLYGGFLGNADGGYEPERELRDREAHPSVIDGKSDLPPDTGDSRRCVTGADNATLDGFTLTGGANWTEGGGAMRNVGVSPTIANCLFENNNASVGGAMYNRDASPELRGCEFLENYAGFGNGGGMYNDEGTTPTLRDCSFVANIAVDFSEWPVQGGGVFNGPGSAPSVFDCTFSQNCARDGGGMFNEGTSLPVVKNTVFVGNRASGRGGGIHNDGESSPVFEATNFVENEAELGGGMYSTRGSLPRIIRCSFEENSATRGGGAYSRLSSVAMSECTFYNNAAERYGGGMFNGSESAPSIEDCTFSGNTAESGGGVYNLESSPSVRGCVFAANQASSGGAFYSYSSSVRISACVFSRNTATYGGGVRSNLDSSLLVGHSILVGNGSGETGGGLDISFVASSFLSNCLVCGNVASTGGALIDGSYSLLAVNCTIADNIATATWQACGGIADSRNYPSRIVNSILWGNSPESLRPGYNTDVTYSLIENGWEGEGNVEGDPAYAEVASGQVTGFSSDPQRHMLTFIHEGSGAVPGALKNMTLWLGEGDQRAAYVVAENDADSLSVWGDAPAAEKVAFPLTYVVMDYRPHPGSPSTDSGCDTGNLELGGVVNDIAGRPRGRDGRGDGAATGDGSDYDMGAHEVLRPFAILTNAGQDYSTTARWLHLEGMCSTQVARVCVNGSDQEVRFTSGSTNWSYSVELSSGGNAFVVVAYDAAGNVAYTADLTVHYHGPVWYVDADSPAAPAEQDGESWATAYVDIQPAVDEASRFRDGGEVWVAEGVYRGDSDPVLSMALKVDLYGGFRGNSEGGFETRRNHRDWGACATVIDGEFGRHCVFGADDATLDGFIITHGSARFGGGMYNSGCSPSIANCIFRENTGSSGAGMQNTESAPVVTDCLFVQNTASGSGAAMANWDASPAVGECVFLQNSSAHSGGAMSNCGDEDPVISGCLFVRNTCGWNGGGMWNSGDSRPVVDRCVFLSNSTTGESGFGGAMSNEGYSAPDVTNCTFAGNKAGRYGGEIYNGHVTNSTFLACVLVGGEARYGGAVCDDCDASSRYLNCLVAGNWSPVEGAFYCRDSSRSVLINCTAIRNATELESRIFIRRDCATIKVVNCILWEDTAVQSETSVSSRSSYIEDGVHPKNTMESNPDPLWAPAPFGVLTQISYDSETFTTTLVQTDICLTPHAFRGAVIWIGDLPDQDAYVVVDNSAEAFTVWGDVTREDAVVSPVTYRVETYHLAAGSPFIDTGRDTSAEAYGGITLDLRGLPRGIDGRGDGQVTGDGSDYDIGAFEAPYPPPSLSDVDGTGAVNAVDFQLVLNEALGIPNVYDCDINRDGRVDAVDIQLLLNAVLGIG